MAGAVALLLAHLLGLTDSSLIVALAVVVGFIPAAITWIVVLVENRRGQSGGTG